MAKEFKTYEELRALLESRGVETDDGTIPALKRESYYAVVNGYKGPFLDRDAMQSCDHDVFSTGTRFEWIYALFMFDRDLRAVTFKYLQRAEAIMRSATVHAFCEAHPEPDAYLKRESYCKADDFLTPKGFRGNRARLHEKNLAQLLRRLKGKALPDSPKPAIDHYMRSYGFVPLWVLSKDMTFGNLHHFYQLLERPVQKRACRLVLEASEAPERMIMQPHDLLRYYSVLVEFRNLCAHDERLYCAKVGKSRDIDYSQMGTCLLNVIQQEQFEFFLEEIMECFRTYGRDLKVVDMDSLLSDMGFKLEK